MVCIQVIATACCTCDLLLLYTFILCYSCQWTIDQLDSAQKPADYVYEGPKPLNFNDPVSSLAYILTIELYVCILCEAAFAYTAV